MNTHIKLVAVSVIMTAIGLADSAEPSDPSDPINVDPNFKLVGEARVTLERDKLWIDPGVIATDDQGAELDTLRTVQRPRVPMN